MFCHEFILADLRVFDNCAKVCTGCDHVFNLAADMGGMGFIQSNHGVIFYNNTMISFNMLEAARKAGIKRCVRDPGVGVGNRPLQPSGKCGGARLRACFVCVASRAATA